jgi:hypothetical protein
MAALAGAAVMVIAALSLAGLQMLIAWEAAAVGDQAARRFPGDRVEALARLVQCEGCALRERNRAVWALGELGGTRALPALESRHTGGPCLHRVALCQYELDKAIRKIRGGWGVRRVLGGSL